MMVTIVQAININQCANLNVAGTTYDLTTTFVNDTYVNQCINITANSVTLDCHGYFINAEEVCIGINHSAIKSTANNTIIKNCWINTNKGNANCNGYSIRLFNSNNTIIQNVSFNISGYMPILAEYSTNITVTKCNSTTRRWLQFINVTASKIENNLMAQNTVGSTQTIDGYGMIDLQQTNNINLTNNTINMQNSNGINIWGSYNILIKNNSMNFIQGDSGLIYYNSSDINWIGGNVSNSRNFSFYLNSGISNYVYNLSIKNSTTDLYLTNLSINNYVINSTLDTNKESVSANSNLYRGWYYDAYVNDAFGYPIQRVNVTAVNSSGDFQWSANTSNDGTITQQINYQYLNSGGLQRNWSNYTISTYNATHSNITYSRNITTSINDTLTYTTGMPNCRNNEWKVPCDKPFTFNNPALLPCDIHLLYTSSNLGMPVLNANWNMSSGIKKIMDYPTSGYFCQFAMNYGTEIRWLI